jgi:hypothetical protein
VVTVLSGPKLSDSIGNLHRSQTIKHRLPLRSHSGMQAGQSQASTSCSSMCTHDWITCNFLMASTPRASAPAKLGNQTMFAGLCRDRADLWHFVTRAKETMRIHFPLSSGASRLSRLHGKAQAQDLFTRFTTFSQFQAYSPTNPIVHNHALSRRGSPNRISRKMPPSKAPPPCNRRNLETARSLIPYLGNSSQWTSLEASERRLSGLLNF